MDNGKMMSVSSLSTFSSSSLTHHDLQRLHRRATQLISSATTTNNDIRRPLTTPGGPTTTSFISKPSPAILKSLQRIIDDMRDSLQQSLNERKRIHSDALELAEAESKDLYDSVLAAQSRASTAEESLAQAKSKLEEYRENASSRFSNELSELKQDWNNQLSATVMQSELRSALERTRSVADEQTLRLKVLTEERSRMIKESTAQKRYIETKEKEWQAIQVKQVETFNQNYNTMKLEKQELANQLLNQENQNININQQFKEIQLKEKELQKKSNQLQTDKEQLQLQLQNASSLLDNNVNKLHQYDTERSSLKNESNLSSLQILKQTKRLKELENQLEETEKTLKDEQASKESMLKGMQDTNSQINQQLIKDAIDNAEKETEKRLHEQYQMSEMKLKSERDEKEKSLILLRQQQQELQRMYKLETEKLINAMENCETHKKNCNRATESLEVTQKEMEQLIQTNKKTVIDLNKNHNLLITAEIAEATSVTRNECEKKFNQKLNDMQIKMEENLKLMNTMRTKHFESNQIVNETKNESNRLALLLNDAKSEIEENQRAVLETLKLSSEIQQSEAEIKAALNREKELHHRMKQDYDTVLSKHSRLTDDLERMRTQRETSETDRNKWKVECEASETISRRATLDLEIAVRRQTDLETDYNRSTINNKELTEQVATHRHESRSKDQQIDTLNRNVRELTLDMERLVNQNRLSSVDSTTKIDEYKSISNQATLALNACDQSLHNKMTEIETLKIEITLKETNITRIEDDMNQLNTESQVLHGKIENSLIREENIRKCNEALNVSFSNSKVNVAKLEERCRTYDARMDAEEERFKKSMDREINTRLQVEKTLIKVSKENELLRKRHDMLALERDRAHEGYSALRKQTERLQNAAREAARKAQIAALTVQRQMMDERLMSSSSSRVKSVSQNSQGGQAAFEAAEDLSWVALGGEKTLGEFGYGAMGKTEGNTNTRNTKEVEKEEMKQDMSVKDL